MQVRGCPPRQATATAVGTAVGPSWSNNSMGMSGLSEYQGCLSLLWQRSNQRGQHSRRPLRFHAQKIRLQQQLPGSCSSRHNGVVISARRYRIDWNPEEDTCRPQKACRAVHQLRHSDALQFGSYPRRAATGSGGDQILEPRQVSRRECAEATG